MNLVFDPSKVEERKARVKEAKMQYDKEFGSMDVAKSYKSLFEILWYSQLPCYDVRSITSEYMDEMSLVKRCYWKGKKINCASIFFTRPTDRGMCCAFNMKRAEEIFHAGKYSNMVSKMQRQDAEYGFENYTQPDWYVKSHEPKTQAGQNKGLQLILDAHTNRVSSGTVSDNFRGFVTVVDGEDKYPLTTRSSFLIRPGRENYVSITATQIYAESGVKNWKPNKRNCYFSDENPLEMHKDYSQSSCILECIIKFARNKIKEQNQTEECTPWFYPVVDEYVTQLCDPWQTKKFQKWITSVPDNQCSHCLPDCETTMYRTRLSAAPFRSCDRTNLGISNLCDLNNTEMNPPMWTKLVEKEYEELKNNTPHFISSKLSNIRNYVPSPEKRESLTFKESNTNNPQYDAFENDIAIVKFYFDIYN